MSLRQTYVLQAAETKFDQLSAEKEKLDSEVKRLNRAVSMLHSGQFLFVLYCNLSTGSAMCRNHAAQLKRSDVAA